MIRALALRSIFALGLATSVAPASAAPTPEGVWATPGGKAQIRLSACGEKLCATLVGLRKPNDKSGKPKLDKRNPDGALRERPVIGMPLTSGMVADAGGWSGSVYNPDDGRTYAGRIEVAGADRITLRGCALKVLCRTQDLTRVR